MLFRSVSQSRYKRHLYGLYPGTHVTLTQTPAIANAAKKTLEIKGDETTGWSKGWRINLWARLKDGEHAYKMYRELLKFVPPDETKENYTNMGGTYPNLLDAHPPFQIDGNFGGAAAVAEMLVQSHTGYIELLPAISKAWNTGSVNGLKARGNYEINMAWNEGQVTKLVIKSPNPIAKVLYNGKYIQGGATAVMPIWHKKKKQILKPYDFLREYVKKDYKKIDWYTFSDPAQSTFAVLLLGHHRTTGQLIFFDEIYEKDREKTSAGYIWPSVQSKRKRFVETVDSDEWKNWYDPAASWFQVDVWDRFQEALYPAKKLKAKNEKDLNSPISRVKDFFAQKDAVWIGSNCVNFIKELDEWSYTKDGKLPDVNDHCIDLLLYIFNNIHISVTPEVEITYEDKLERGQSVAIANINDLLHEAGLQKDPFMHLGNSLVLDEKENDYGDEWSDSGGSHFVPSKRDRLSKKRVSFDAA